MTFSIHGIAVSRGIAIGRAVLVASNRADVAHYFVDADKVADEIARVRAARNAVIDEIVQVQQTMPPDAPPELAALLDVHLMLLQDEQLISGVKHWITERHYNAEWALTTQYDAIARQFDEMQDPYLRERKVDLAQVVERILSHIKGVPLPVTSGVAQRHVLTPGSQPADVLDAPLVLVAHDISPADMLQFRESLFVGFATDVGGKTSHTALVARSMDIPAVVGARNASQLIAQDDWVIIDGDAGVLIVDPSPAILTEYQKRQQWILEQRAQAQPLPSTAAVTRDGQAVELLANIEMPGDALAAAQAGAMGIGLFRSEFLFMGREGQLPDEEEQYQAYRTAVEAMAGRPVTLRTVDIGADKPLDKFTPLDDRGHLNPALGLRAIRWSLADPTIFLTQLRAMLRAAAHGQVHILIPMLAHASEIRQTLALIDQARNQLDTRGVAYGPVQLGALIEVPAAALQLPLFLKHFDFLSIGTNDLAQYTLAVDRADETVAHLYDPLHPAVLGLIANTIAACRQQGKRVTVCGEMGGDPSLSGLLLGLGLRSFSMYPSQIAAVKQQVLRADTRLLEPWAQTVLQAEDPAQALAAEA